MYDLARAITDDRLRTAERRRRARQVRQLQREQRTASRTRAADRIEPPLAEAGTLPIGDVRGWGRLRARAAAPDARRLAQSSGGSSSNSR